jgi:hypothetical protein
VPAGWQKHKLAKQRRQHNCCSYHDVQQQLPRQRAVSISFQLPTAKAACLLTCETNKQWLQLNDLAVHRAANGIAQNQDVLALALTLPQNQGDKAVCRIIITGNEASYSATFFTQRSCIMHPREDM